MNNYSIEASKEIGNIVNTTAFNGADVAEVTVNGSEYEAPMHRYLQNELFKFAIAYIFKLAEAKEKGKFDDRNKDACNKASEIVRLIKENGETYEQNPLMWSLVERYSK